MNLDPFGFVAYSLILFASAYILGAKLYNVDYLKKFEQMAIKHQNLKREIKELLKRR